MKMVKMAHTALLFVVIVLGSTDKVFLQLN